MVAVGLSLRTLRYCSTSAAASPSGTTSSHTLIPTKHSASCHMSAPTWGQAGRAASHSWRRKLAKGLSPASSAVLSGLGCLPWRQGILCKQLAPASTVCSSALNHNITSAYVGLVAACVACTVGETSHKPSDPGDQARHWAAQRETGDVHIGPTAQLMQQKRLVDWQSTASTCYMALEL